jgi:hypothetical protein
MSLVLRGTFLESRTTDYYSQQSCTAGRAAFITGQAPFRTGLLKVGMPAAKQGLQDKDPTIAELLKPLTLTAVIPKEPANTGSIFFGRPVSTRSGCLRNSDRYRPTVCVADGPPQGIDDRLPWKTSEGRYLLWSPQREHLAATGYFGCGTTRR